MMTSRGERPSEETLCAEPAHVGLGGGKLDSDSMPFWPFRRKKRDEESFFGSTGGAQVVPAAPPTVGAAAPAPPASDSSPGAPAAPSGIPQEVLQQLAAAGIHLDPNANVQVSTQTAQLSGQQALQFLGQLSSVLGSAGWSGSTFQVHPQVNLVSEGRLQESAEQLRATGLAAKATVKDLEDKLAMGADTHLVKLKLLVEREGAEPYETTTAAIVPATVTEQFAEGKTFPAKVDPNDRNQVLVLFS
jgi:hypothetical protein